MKQRLFYLFLIPLLVGCSNKNRESRIDTSLTARDEFGVRYNPDDLKKENVFVYSYPDVHAVRDTGEERLSYSPYFIEARPSQYIDSSLPYELDIYIGINPKVPVEEKFDSYIPYLVCQYPIGGDYTRYGFKRIGSKQLPNRNEADFSAWRLDFPTKDRTYFGYRFHTTFTLDFEFRKNLSNESERNVFFSIRRFNPEINEFEKLERNYEGLKLFSEYWSNSIQITYSYQGDSMVLVKKSTTLKFIDI